MSVLSRRAHSSLYYACKHGSDVIFAGEALEILERLGLASDEDRTNRERYRVEVEEVVEAAIEKARKEADNS